MLGRDSLIKIVDILMNQVGKRIRDLGMDIELTQSIFQNFGIAHPGQLTPLRNNSGTEQNIIIIKAVSR